MAMGNLYFKDENTVVRFKDGSQYVGFLNGTECSITPEPLKIRSHTIQPGEKIKGFVSGSSRTSYILPDDVFMRYKGRIDQECYFELNIQQQINKDVALSHDLPCWFLAFGHIESMDRFLMLSGPGRGWDIVPKELMRYDG